MATPAREYRCTPAVGKGPPSRQVGVVTNNNNEVTNMSNIDPVARTQWLNWLVPEETYEAPEAHEPRDQRVVRQWEAALTEALRPSLLLKVLFLWLVLSVTVTDENMLVAGIIAWGIWFFRLYCVWYDADDRSDE